MSRNRTFISIAIILAVVGLFLLKDKFYPRQADDNTITKNTINQEIEEQTIKTA